MRDRKEVIDRFEYGFTLKGVKLKNGRPDTTYLQMDRDFCILEVLLDIRDALLARKENPAPLTNLDE